jgi:hypothetical protein
MVFEVNNLVKTCLLRLLEVELVETSLLESLVVELVETRSQNQHVEPEIDRPFDKLRELRRQLNRLRTIGG